MTATVRVILSLSSCIMYGFVSYTVLFRCPRDNNRTLKGPANVVATDFANCAFLREDPMKAMDTREVWQVGVPDLLE